MPSLVNLGTPVISSRQWTTGLSPNPRGGWNYMAASWPSIHSTSPIEWPLIKDLTTAPTETITDTTVGFYPNSHFEYTAAQTAQLRAGNGRIFFPCFQLYTVYYDPTTETINQIGPVVETPPLDPHQSTTFYSASFDVAGLLYFGSQESGNRPACIVSTDTTTTPPTQTVLGYVGSGAAGFTTYAYYLAPDTATATKYIYVVYGEDPWQLWALDITTGAATLLEQVSSTGAMSFANIAGQGWVCTIHTDVGKPDDVVTKVWCLDGATYPYTPSVPPPMSLARNVTPASNPLVNPPGLDTTGGIGVVGWRANGSGGPYDYVNYSVPNAAPIVIESLVTTPDGVFGNAQNYLGFFRYVQATDETTWFGAQVGIDVAQPLELYVASDGKIYTSGYPNGVLYEYDPTIPWQTNPSLVNPILLGNYGPNGTGDAGIKYSGNPNPPTNIGSSGNLLWVPGAGSDGRLFCAGQRDRSGTGGGIGFWDRGSSAFAGTFASPLDTLQPQGLAVDTTHGYVTMSTNTLSGSGTAPLLVYDYDFDLLFTQNPISGQSNLGPIFQTSSADVVLGAYIAAGVLNLYRWNVQSGSMVQGPTATAFAGAIDCATVNQADGSVWLVVGDTIVRVDPDTMTATSGVDITTIAPVSCAAFYGTSLFMSSGATLYSTVIPQNVYTLSVSGGLVEISGGDVTMSIGTKDVLSVGGGLVEVTGGDVTFALTLSMDVNGGLVIVTGGEVEMVIGIRPPFPDPDVLLIPAIGLEFEPTPLFAKCERGDLSLFVPPKIIKSGN